MISSAFSESHLVVSKQGQARSGMLGSSLNFDGVTDHIVSFSLSVPCTFLLGGTLAPQLDGSYASSIKSS